MEKKSRIITASIIAGVVVAGATAAIITAVILTAGPKPFTTFQDAAESCNVSSGVVSSGVLVSDNGTTLTIDMMGEDEYDGATYDKTMCVINAIPTPAFVVNQIENTRALDGMQSADFDDITAQWNYSPSNGLSITYHKK